MSEVWVRCKIPGCTWQMTREELRNVLDKTPRKKWEEVVAGILVHHLLNHFRHRKSIMIGIAQMGRKGFDKYLWVDWQWLEEL